MLPSTTGFGAREIHSPVIGNPILLFLIPWYLNCGVTLGYARTEFARLVWKKRGRIRVDGGDTVGILRAQPIGLSYVTT